MELSPPESRCGPGRRGIRELFCTVAIVFMTEVLSTVASACPFGDDIAVCHEIFRDLHAVRHGDLHAVPPRACPPATVVSPRCTATDFAAVFLL